jgi:spore coat protein U-like protein
MTLKKISLCLLTCTCISSAAYANSTNSNFNSTASIASNCVVSSTDINFGSISPQASGQATATATVQAKCTNTTAYTINIGPGASGSFSQRTLTGTKSGNTDSLNYQIYEESTHVNILGDGSSNTVPLAGVGSGAFQNFTVYGLLYLNQYITPDVYRDALSVTINY